MPAPPRLALAATYQAEADAAGRAERLDDAPWRAASADLAIRLRRLPATPV